MAILISDSDFVRAASGTWQQQMKWAIRDLATLRQRLDLPPGDEAAARAAGAFPVFVPLPLLARMRPGDPTDPLLLQVLPQGLENSSPSHFRRDPLGEAQATVRPGLLHKYRGRVLLVTTGACAVHCRYCFRRHHPYDQGPVSMAQWRPALEAIQADASISEVILSGGDPLTLTDARLGELIDALAEIPQLKTLRIHTRLPIMIPQRITDELLATLQRFPGNRVTVIHCNHAAELDAGVGAALQRLRQATPLLLNQAVLLQGINDQLTDQVQLSRRLIEVGVLPYYLHQLDPVEGASHFETAGPTGPELIAAMRALLPGYAVPRLVQEQPGQPHKTVLA